MSCQQGCMRIRIDLSECSVLVVAWSSGQARTAVGSLVLEVCAAALCSGQQRFAARRQTFAKMLLTWICNWSPYAALAPQTCTCITATPTLYCRSNPNWDDFKRGLRKADTHKSPECCAACPAGRRRPGPPCGAGWRRWRARRPRGVRSPPPRSCGTRPGAGARRSRWPP